MKPFDIEKAKRGEKVVTKNGNEVVELLFGSTTLVGLIKFKGSDYLAACMWYPSGKKVYYSTPPEIIEAGCNDLCMYEEPAKEYYLNIFKERDTGHIIGGVFKNEKEAKQFVSSGSVVKVVEVK